MTGKTILVDSCVWIGLIDINDTNHKKALSALISLQGGRVEVYDFIYSEVLTVLKRKINIEGCHNFLRLLLEGRVKIKTSQNNLYQEANQYFFKYKKLSFPDCLLLATAMKEKAELVSFDKNLMNAYRTLC